MSSMFYSKMQQTIQVFLIFTLENIQVNHHSRALIEDCSKWNKVILLGWKKLEKKISTQFYYFKLIYGTLCILVLVTWRLWYWGTVYMGSRGQQISKPIHSLFELNWPNGSLGEHIRKLIKWGPIIPCIKPLGPFLEAIRGFFDKFNPSSSFSFIFDKDGWEEA